MNNKILSMIKDVEFYYRNERKLHKSNDIVNIFTLRTEKDCVWQKL